MSIFSSLPFDTMLCRVGFGFLKPLVTHVSSCPDCQARISNAVDSLPVLSMFGFSKSQVEEFFKKLSTVNLNQYLPQEVPNEQL